MNPLSNEQAHQPLNIAPSGEHSEPGTSADLTLASISRTEVAEPAESPAEVRTAPRTAKDFPALADINGVYGGNFGGDACITQLRPGQAQAIIELCKDRNLSIPQIERNGASLSFQSDVPTREKMLSLIGVHKPSDVARDPDFRANDSTAMTYLKKAIAFITLTPPTPVQSYEEVAAEMKLLQGGRGAYLKDWYYELRQNCAGIPGEVYFAHRTLLNHIERLKNSELIAGEDLAKWEHAFKLCADRRLY